MYQSEILAAAKRIGEITAEKNLKYGNSVGVTERILSILYPLGIRVDQYKDAFLVVRIIDKMNRIANAKDAFGESPFLDIAGYGVMGEVMRNQKEDKDNEHSEFVR